MNTNVRPGDKAIVIKSRLPENLGVIVEVIDYANPGYIFPDGKLLLLDTSETCWIVESLGRKLKTTIEDTQGRYISEDYYQMGVCPDKTLKKLPDSDDVKEFDEVAKENLILNGNTIEELI